MHQRTLSTARLAVACLHLLPAARAAAWGPLGHRAVAIIAEERLTPRAKAGLSDIFGRPPNLVALAACADDLVWAERDPRQPLDRVCAEVFANPPSHTERWHYINLNIRTKDPTDVEIRAACRRECVVAQIPRLAATLADVRAPRTERARAAAFLVHLVGDIHQPLHAGDRDDHGGNDVEVRFLGKPPRKLHSVWDSDIPRLIAPTPRGIVASAAAEVRLAEKERPLPLPAWVMAWVRESLAAARDVAEAGVSPPPTVTRLGREYADQARDAARRRIAQAGVRLAAVLNEAFERPR